MSKIVKIIALIFFIAGLIYFSDGIKFNSVFGTGQRVGPLIIDFHVPKGKPIFKLYDVKPGDVYQRNIDVTNKGNVPKKILIEGKRTGGTGSNPKIETVLDIVIKEGANVLYGPKKLSQFFTDSQNPNKIFLDTINPGVHKTYVFQVSLPILAGNEFQKKSVIFNIRFLANPI